MRRFFNSRDEIILSYEERAVYDLVWMLYCQSKTEVMFDFYEICKISSMDSIAIWNLLNDLCKKGILIKKDNKFGPDGMMHGEQY